MVEDWQENIKPFSKAIQRDKDNKKLREKIRLKTTGIKVDLMAGKVLIKRQMPMQ